MGSVAQAGPLLPLASTSTCVEEPKMAKTFLDLPLETQKEIFSHCPSGDLICLSVVCKHFRHLAAADLYRNFHILFPDDGDRSYDGPINSLAAGFETFATSDYDYAQHLRYMSFETDSTGAKGEMAYKPYLATTSCGKFMNTLLLITLKKACCLETLRWNIRVELSRPVYQALHRIKTLVNLSIRMQDGPSLYEPPMPYGTFPENIPPALTPAPLSQFWPPSSHSLPITPEAYVAHKAQCRWQPPVGKNLAPMAVAKEPPTLSGFKNLKTLSVLDIDSLEVIPELGECVQNSASTLSRLQVSFSHHFALQARRPIVAPLLEPLDSDEDDEYHIPVPANHHTSHSSAGPSTAVEAVQMRRKQEATLGIILGLSANQQSENKTSDRENSSDSDKTKPTSDPLAPPASFATPGEAYIASINHVAQKLLNKFGTPEQEELLDVIMKASKKYVESHDTLTTTKPDGEIASSNDTSNGTSNGALTQTTGSTVASPQKPKDGNKDVVVEAINIEEPLELLTLDFSDDKDVEAESSGTSAEKVEGEGKAEAVTQQRPLRTIKKNIQEAKEELQNKTQGDYATSCISERNSIAEYVHSTRGLPLRYLGLHLIPIKAWVLLKTIDFRSLRRLTLLNVGNQAPLWLRLTEMNKEEPLPLTKISTDHVCPRLLTLASQLKEIHELLILERSAKHTPESFAPKSQVKIADIRKQILKKHLPHLKRLMIKNEADGNTGGSPLDTGGTSADWDIDEKTMLLICRKGRLLQELSISTCIKGVHMLAQHIGGLVNLKALHIQKFRNEDTCVWVMRETRRFVRDNLAHHPNLKLEWMCMDNDRVDKIRLHAQPEPKKKRGMGKGKDRDAAGTFEVAAGLDMESGNGAAGSASGSAAGGLHYPTLSTANLDGAVDAGEGSDDDSMDSADEDVDIKNLRVEVVDTVAFYDVWGVRIFEKEVMDGTL